MDKPHKKLDVEKLSIDLADAVYRLTATFPPEEKFGLISQLRRAEGAARSSRKEFEQFLSIARGSLSEWDTQLGLSMRLGLIAKQSRAHMDRLMR